MVNNIQLFNYEGKEVRTVVKDNEIYWVGKEICEMFGDTNYRRSLDRLDEDEKGVSHMDTPGGKQKMTMVNESGLYTLLFNMQPEKSNNEYDEQTQQRITQLKAFKRWITHEIIPSIRKTGGYGNVEQPISQDLALRIAKEKRLTERLAIDSKRVDLERAKFLAELLEKQSPLLPPSSTQRAMSEISEMILGKQVIELPVLGCKFYSLGEILDEFNKANGTNFTKQKVGRILKPHNLQVAGSEYGEFFKDKSRSSEKEMPSFRYNEKGKQKVIEIIKNELMK